MRPGGKRPPLALRLFTILLFVHRIVAGLDRGRFHWSDSVPPWLQTLGLIAVAGGYALCFWAMAVSRFFSPVTRIVRDHIIRRRPVAGEGNHCSGDRRQNPRDFLSAAYARRRNARLRGKWLCQRTACVAPNLCVRSYGQRPFDRVAAGGGAHVLEDENAHSG
jgi:hypothetical protein